MKRMNVFSRLVRLLPVFISSVFLSWMFLPDISSVDVDNQGLHSIPDYNDPCDERTPAFIFKLINVLNAVYYDKSRVEEIKLLNMGLRAIEAELRANGVPTEIPPLPDDTPVARGQYCFEGHFMAARRELFRLYPRWEATPDLGLAIGKRLLLEFGSSHTGLIPPKLYKHYSQDFDLGVIHYKRWGLLVAEKHDGSVSCVYVDRVAPASPAYEAGFRRFDLFLDSSGMRFVRSLGDLWDMIGDNQSVDVQVVRAGTRQLAGLHLPVVTWLDENPCVISTASREMGSHKFLSVAFHVFTPRAIVAMAERVNEMRPSGLVIDLRNNLGGFTDALDSFWKMFLPSGTGTYTECPRNGEPLCNLVSSSDDPWRLPVVILVNENTSCGGELAAQILLDNKRAFIVGVKTAGRTEMVDWNKAVKISEVTAVNVSNASIKTAAGTVLEGRGGFPQYCVDLMFEDISAGRDPQLDRAFEVLLGEVSK